MIIINKKLLTSNWPTIVILIHKFLLKIYTNFHNLILKKINSKTWNQTNAYMISLTNKEKKFANNQLMNYQAVK